MRAFHLEIRPMEGFAFDPYFIINILKFTGCNRLAAFAIDCESNGLVVIFLQ